MLPVIALSPCEFLVSIRGVMVFSPCEFLVSMLLIVVVFPYGQPLFIVEIIPALRGRVFLLVRGSVLSLALG